tara:strand:+ start:393 stop:623 length:231 start_codon:yes stop_codon:yes gene_type:complete
MNTLTNDQIITAALNMTNSECKTIKRVGILILSCTVEQCNRIKRIEKLISNYVELEFKRELSPPCATLILKNSETG